MKWQLAEVPVKRTRSGNMWDHMIPADLIRAMRSYPGSTFQMLDDDGQRTGAAGEALAGLQRAYPTAVRLLEDAAEPVPGMFEALEGDAVQAPAPSPEDTASTLAADGEPAPSVAAQDDTEESPTP